MDFADAARRELGFLTEYGFCVAGESSDSVTFESIRAIIEVSLENLGNLPESDADTVENLLQVAASKLKKDNASLRGGRRSIQSFRRHGLNVIVNIKDKRASGSTTRASLQPLPHPPGDPPTIGVREPRRPRAPHSGGSIALQQPDDEPQPDEPPLQSA